MGSASVDDRSHHLGAPGQLYLEVVLEKKLMWWIDLSVGLSSHLCSAIRCFAFGQKVNRLFVLLKVIFAMVGLN